MPWRDQHRAIANRPFTWRCAANLFRRDEAEFLRKWGSWMEALWRGELLPATTAQTRFVHAVRDDEPCRTFSQDLWRRYLIYSKMQVFSRKSEYKKAQKPWSVSDRDDGRSAQAGADPGRGTHWTDVNEWDCLLGVNIADKSEVEYSEAAAIAKNEKETEKAPPVARVDLDAKSFFAVSHALRDKVARILESLPPGSSQMLANHLLVAPTSRSVPRLREAYWDGEVLKLFDQLAGPARYYIDAWSLWSDWMDILDAAGANDLEISAGEVILEHFLSSCNSESR